MPVRRTERVVPVGHGEQILLVDDECVLVFVGTMALQQKGYRVVGVSSGEAALREFQRRPQAFDAVISDLSMRLCQDCGSPPSCENSAGTSPLF